MAALCLLFSQGIGGKKLVFVVFFFFVFNYYLNSIYSCVVITSI